MTQPTNYTIGDGTGAQTIAAINLQIQSLRDHFSGATEPTNAVLGQLYYDTTNDLLKIFNGSNFIPLPFNPLTGTILGTTFTDIPLGALSPTAIDLDLADGYVGDTRDSNDIPISTGALVSAEAVATYVDDHEERTSDVHGVTSDIVGIDDPQTIQNKTIVAPIVEGGKLRLIEELTFAGDAIDLGDVKLIIGSLETSDDIEVGGDATIEGNLTVNGTINTVSSTNTTIEDKTITLANGATTQTGVNNSGLLFGDQESFLYTTADGFKGTAVFTSEGYKVSDGSNIISVINDQGTWIGKVIPITHGGTGAATAFDARANLGLGDSATTDVGTIAGTVAEGDHIHNITSSDITGVLPPSKGGTGGTEDAVDGAILVGTGTYYDAKVLTGGPGIEIASTDDTLTVSVDATTLTGITPTGTPEDGDLIIANVVGENTTYEWGAPEYSTDINWNSTSLSGTPQAARQTIQATGNLNGGATGSISVEGFSFKVNNTNSDPDLVTLDFIYSDGLSQAGSLKVLASVNVKDLLANVNLF